MEDIQERDEPFNDLEWKSLKIAFKGMLLIICIILSIIVVGALFGQSITSDIDYRIDVDALYSDDSISAYTSSYNLQRVYGHSQEYNASYSFYNETGDPIGFVLDEPSNTYIAVESSKSGHDDVLAVSDQTAVDDSYAELTYDSGQATGTVEFWWSAGGTSSSRVMDLRFGWSTLADLYITFRIVFHTNYVYLQRDGGNTDLINPFVANVWYHFEVEWDCSADEVSVWVNEVLMADALGFYHAHSTVDKMRIATWGASCNSAEKLYWDAFGLSWLSNYSLKQNIEPVYTVDDSIMEIRAFEFGLEDEDDYYDVGDDNPDGFTESELNGDDININFDTNQGNIWYDRVVEFLLDGDDASGSNSIYRNMGITDSQVYNITWSWYFETIDNPNANVHLTAKSTDASYLTIVRVLESSGSLLLQYNDGGGYNTLRSDLVINTQYEFNVYINNYDGLCTLLYYVDGVYTARYRFDAYTKGKTGLNEVKIETSTFQSAGNDFRFDLDYVGVFGNYSTLSDDFGYATLNLTSTDIWYTKSQYLFNITAFGRFEVGVCVHTYIPEETVYEMILSTRTYDNTTLINIYDWESAIWTNEQIPLATLVMYVDTTINLTALSISGVKAVSGTTDLRFTYTFTGVNNSESYFYADNTSHRLYWLFEADNSTTLESMTATLSTSSVSTINASFHCKSRLLTGFADGFVYLNYGDATSSIITMHTYQVESNLLLVEENTLASFTISITDSNSSLNSNNTGYISEISLVFVPNYSLTVSTLALIEVMIPLVVMLIPSFAIGKKLGKRYIVPMLMVMSLVCFAGGLIPTWLFFAMLVGFFVLLFFQFRSSRGEVE